MALKNLFDMVKADRYTADGREALIKAQEAEIEDKVYQIGEISQKTGLQKTANGWVKPKNGKQPGAKNAETNYGKVEKKDGKWGVQQKLGKGSQFIEHKDKKDATEALKNYTEGYNTTERSKQDPHSDEARQVKQWNKETDKIRKASNAERRAEHAAHFQNEPQKLSAAEQNARRNQGITANEIKTGNQYQNENGAKINITGTGNDGSIQFMVTTSEGTKQSLHARSKEEMERILSVNGYAAESKPDGADRHDEIGGEIKGNLEAAKYYFDKAQSFSTTDPSYKTYMGKAKEYNDKAKAQADDYGFDWEEMHNRGITQAVNTYAKENTDAAPRVLTGDTRIRVRKA